MAKASTLPAKKKKAAAPPSAPPKKKAAAGKSPALKAAAKKAAAKKAAAAKAPTKKAAPKKTAPPKAAQKTSSMQKAPAMKAPSKKAPAKMAPARKTPAKATAKKSAPVLKSSAKKPPARTVSVKQAAARRGATKAALPPIRRTRVVVSVKRPRAVPVAKPAAPAATARPPQTFTASHLHEADFKTDGLRPYARYRDLGIAAATAGLCQAHVIRFIPPTTDEVRKRHTHSVDLQLVYVLKGWIKNEFEGYGSQMMSTGSCWLQPSGLAHTVLEYSPDCEVLEIIVPADFKTQDLTEDANSDIPSDAFAEAP